MSRIRDQLTSRENLRWAWAKARRMYEAADGPVDWGAIATFELDLEAQLQSIANAFKSPSFKLDPIILLPQPKKPDDDGTPRMRQSFHVSVRDQVAWVAVANVIGPLLDSQMPAWVYGHRLYKAAWFEEFEQGEHRLALGPYRHSTGALYRKFKHSWPLFRRHVSLSSRMMAGGLDEDVELDEAEKAALNYQDRPAYLAPGWWQSDGQTALHYASIDLERFYPTIKQSAIVAGLRTYLPDYQEDPWLQSLVDQMLRFSVSPAGSASLGDEVVQPKTPAGRFRGIPTGLMVAGFLSNVAMLRLDLLAEQELIAHKRIAHFRFVDDHVILAYNFNELRKWIQWYEDKLGELKIGPRISPTKFDPPIMAKAYRRGSKLDDRASARALTKIDGRRPSHLMTKTLALVSELAGANFDILSATSKSERLRELEWLLVADLPEREIRRDTRAAFAAGRMATLVPVATTPSREVLSGFRELARINNELARATAARDEHGLAVLQLQRIAMSDVVADHRRAETQVYRKSLAHYFKLMWQAFQDHPEKPRLFLRLLDYCRTTGHSGTGAILKWLNSGEGPPPSLANYLRPLAVQTIARHVVTAAHELNDQRLLERQRLAARSYLNSLVRRDVVKDVRIAVGQAQANDVAARFAASCFRAALAWAGEVAADYPRLQGRLAFLQAQAGSPALSTPSAIWKELTGYPLGAWAHWLEKQGQRHAVSPSDVWRSAAPALDPGLRADMQNLRKGLSQPPLAGHETFSSQSLQQGRLSDSGLALEHLRSSQYVRVEGKLSPSQARVARHQLGVVQQKSKITLSDWVESLAHAPAHDPRRSEWTALEILRQLVAPIGLLGGPDALILDHLHPANVLVPRAWTSPPENGFSKVWTWETWRTTTRESPRALRISRSRIIDYRRELTGPKQSLDETSIWRARLHGCGLLLLGLVSQDFRLPAYWNVRGLEGDIGGFVRRKLEEVAVSSRTQGIIEAALLPRSLETAFIQNSPWAFYGSRTVSEINDTRSDPPFIQDLDGLVSEIEEAQRVLEERQISVLHHAPRQLIPMNISQLGGAAVEIFEVDPLE